MDFEKAIDVDSIAAEYDHVNRHPCSCGGQFKVAQQSLLHSPQQVPHDLLYATCQKCNRSEEFLFNVSSFFGESAW